MKAKIRIKTFPGTLMPKVIEKGEWVDLRAAFDTWVGIQPVTYVPLGVAMKLPEGYEAIIAPRSSTPEKFHIWCVNSFGVIDGSYSGNNDEWKFPCTTIGTDRTLVHKGDRICQFRIQLSQKATWWQKLKWLFTSGIELEYASVLDDVDRGGIGSTGQR